MKRLLVLLPLVCGCSCNPPAPSPTPHPIGDASPAFLVWDDNDPCGSAYARLQFLDCEPVAPATSSWVTACLNARANGLKFGCDCIALLTDRGAVGNCGVSCR